MNVIRLSNDSTGGFQDDRSRTTKAVIVGFVLFLLIMLSLAGIDSDYYLPFIDADWHQVGNEHSTR